MENGMLLINSNFLSVTMFFCVVMFVCVLVNGGVRCLAPDRYNPNLVNISFHNTLFYCLSSVLFVLFYDLTGLVKLTEILKNNPHVNEVEVPEKVGGFEEKEVSEAKEIFEAFRKQLAENKPKKGKGKKGGKKKKKKG